MKEKICSYCGQRFQPSRYHSGQRVCSTIECQRRRRADYHRRKLIEDSIYREQCQDSQKSWREKNRGYMKEYRAAQRKQRADVQNDALVRRLLDAVKNNVAFDLRSTRADIWLVCPPEIASEKNTFANAKVIVLQGSLTALVPAGC
jgi:hypothetical protein